ncbi:NAD(P)H-dependent oxidoreductase subunit E [Draconibacterium halophilum]|uniref:4Fe-4S dicluster domain-containing protein n=1 Tax=Draconibacterium halophilum TaxID=2706887 RepID=A0A6C0RC95_9BACT|nr:NAD(P)H-dependent oxidoreductase subunit E [Draconibacterium halophilum]QIA07522.1 4Fe-4S dicluster domain-containing protein [Draconibacterium halophilum]
MTEENKNIDQLIQEKGSTKKSLIPILQAIQKEYNYLPEDLLRLVAEKTEISLAEIVGVASFYSQFRLQPVGEHMIKVCVGTACHVKGAGQVYDAFRRELKLEEGQETEESGEYTLEQVACLGCCTLAPVVQIDETTYGHVASDQVGQVIADFESLKGTKSAKKARKADGSEIQGEIRIGLGSCCVASGSKEIEEEVEHVVNDSGLRVSMKHVGCVGMCHQVPLVEVVPNEGEATLYAKVKPEDVKNIVESHFQAPGLFTRLKNKLLHTVEDIQTDRNWDGIERYEISMREKPVASFLGKQIPIATEYRGIINPLDINEYLKRGGFSALEKVLNKMAPDEVIREVKDSGVRGRGGAGFPTGIKWELVKKHENDIKYIICNGDEGDPGAFMDRMLLESYPYRVIEGMIIAAYATDIHQGYFYIRAEYPLAVKRIREALKICEAKNYLGKNILGSGFDLDLQIYEGAGAFVCGEESALIASIEGNRGFPRMRPPFPAESGLWGKPTLVNNTETLAQISYILREGAEGFSKIGSGRSTGTKVFSLAGKIARGGLIEVPMGITIKQVIEEIGGGIANSRTFKAVQIGGPSGGCIPAAHSDTPIDFESLGEMGAMMGSGGLVVLDDTDCMVDIARYFLSFTQEESCGKCTFCRVGTKRMLDILDGIVSGKGKKGDIEELEHLAGWTKKGSLCGLGKTAPNPVLSTLRHFRDEYEAHINGTCPTGKCAKLITYSVNDECIGCTKCVQKCPVDAIPFTPHEKHSIDTELCIKCDACRAVCPVDAIDVK